MRQSLASRTNHVFFWPMLKFVMMSIGRKSLYKYKPKTHKNSFLSSFIFHIQDISSSEFIFVYGLKLEYSCLENPVDRGAWWAAVHRVAQSWTRLERLSMHASQYHTSMEWVAISFSNACMHAKSLQSCPALCDPMDSSPPGSSVHRIL